MAVVPLSTFLGRPAGTTAPPPSLSPAPRIVPLRTFLGGDGAAAQPLTRAPAVRATRPTIPGVNPALADLSRARAALGLVGSAGNITNLVNPRAIPAQALGAVQGLGGALQLALALSREGKPLPRALGAAAGATNLIGGASRAFPAAAQAILPASALSSLPYVGAALGIASSATGKDPDYIKAIDSAAYAAAPFTFGLSALVPLARQHIQSTLASDAPDLAKAWDIVQGPGGAFVRKLFGLGGKPDVPHEVRETREAARDIGAASPMGGDLQSARTVDELFAKGLPWMSGYVGGSRTPAVSVGAMIPEEFVGMAPGATIPAWAREQMGSGGQPAPKGLVQVGWLFGNLNPHYPAIRPEKRVEALRWIGQNPEAAGLRAMLQSGISPELKTDFNQAIAAVVSGVLGIPPKTPAGPTAPAPSPQPQPPTPNWGGVPITQAMELAAAQVAAQIRSGGVSSEFGRYAEDVIPDLVTAENLARLMASRPDISTTWLARSAQPSDLGRLLGPIQSAREQAEPWRAVAPSGRAWGTLVARYPSLGGASEGTAAAIDTLIAQGATLPQILDALYQRGSIARPGMEPELAYSGNM